MTADDLSRQGHDLIEQRDYARAMDAINAALAIDENHAGALTGMGLVLRASQHYPEALECFAAATRADPGYAKAWFLLATLQELTGDLDGAEATVAAGRAAVPDDNLLVLAQARLLRRRKKDMDALRILDPILPRITDDTPEAHRYVFEAGQLCDRTDDTGRAFSFFERGNRLLAQSPKFKAISRDAYPDHIKMWRAAIAAPFTPFSPSLPASAPQPVFLVGFPRSGTTLLETALAGHPDIESAEELPVMSHVLNKIGHPRNLYPLTAAQAVELRALFFKLHAGFGAKLNKPTFIDKMPLNMIQAAAIARLFPEAKFILALRHPCDCVLSCFMQAFQPNEAMIHFLDIGDAARLYDRAFDLWTHLRGVLDFPVHEIRYEDVVQDQRAAIAGVLSYLGLPWNDAVLAHDKTAAARQVNTPSYAQVSEKIYTRASGRWLKYQDRMQDVMPVLAPWAEAFGYGNL